MQNTASRGDALIAAIRSSLGPDGVPTFGHLVLYTSFGVVRGRTGLTFGLELMSAGADVKTPDAIELNDVSVEHYSNHLPTAAFDRLYVRLSDIQGFAMVGPG